MKTIEQVLDSREVADMIKKVHAELLKDVRRYIKQLNQVNIPFVDFFQESTYQDSKGEQRPCYKVTRKGCEFIAHKLTGVKGTEFTAKYINRFHEMEDMLQEKTIESNLSSKQSRTVTLKEQLECAKMVAEDFKVSRIRKAAIYQQVYTANSVPCTYFEPIIGESRVEHVFPDGTVKMSLKGIEVPMTAELNSILQGMGIAK